MDRNITQELIDKFKIIKEGNPYEVAIAGDGKVGDKFEHLLGKVTDNKYEADYFGTELKTKSVETDSMLSLFSLAPSYPKSANTYLRETYGYFQNEEDDVKVLNTTVSATSWNTLKNKFSFKAKVDKKQNKIQLLIKNLDQKDFIDDTVYWDFKDIKERVDAKLANVCYATWSLVSKNLERKTKMVNFENLEFTNNLNFGNFMDYVESGKILIDIRIGAYRSGPNKGKTHDHGTGFRMKRNEFMEIVSEPISSK